MHAHILKTYTHTRAPSKIGGTEVLYLFKQTTFADHAPNEDILKALGIQPAAAGESKDSS